jgi:hypothetical protein
MLKTTQHAKIKSFLLYPTDPWIVEALLKVESFEGKVWEPCAGRGDISKVLISHGMDVYSSELSAEYGYGETGIDFLTNWKHVDSIITNPPWISENARWLLFPAHAIHLARKTAMLLPMYFLDHSQRRKFVLENPPKAIYAFQPKVWTHHVIAWWVWERGFEGETTLRWLMK